MLCILIYIIIKNNMTIYTTLNYFRSNNILDISALSSLGNLKTLTELNLNF